MKLEFDASRSVERGMLNRTASLLMGVFVTGILVSRININEVVEVLYRRRDLCSGAEDLLE